MKTTIQTITIDIISIIIALIAIAIHIEIIKDALNVDSVPPLYTLRLYTCIAAGAMIAGLLYFSVSKAVDLYNQYVSIQILRMKLEEERKLSAKDFYPSPINHTIEQCKEYMQINEEKTREEIRHVLVEEEDSTINPIDLKFDKMIEGAKEASINLKKKRNVQK